MPAPKGNKNAQKNNPKREIVCVSVTQKQKEKWHNKAAMRQMKLSEYIRFLVERDNNPGIY